MQGVCYFRFVMFILYRYVIAAIIQIVSWLEVLEVQASCDTGFPYYSDELDVCPANFAVTRPPQCALVTYARSFFSMHPHALSSFHSSVSGPEVCRSFFPSFVHTHR